MYSVSFVIRDTNQDVLIDIPVRASSADWAEFLARAMLRSNFGFGTMRIESVSVTANT